MSRKLIFRDIEEGAKVEVEILDNKSNKMISLGIIYYNKRWKEWIWNQYKDIEMAKGCLAQVSVKLGNLNELSKLLGNYP